MPQIKNESIHCLIVDNEETTLNYLCDYIRKIPQFKLIHICKDVMEAEAIVMNQKIDVCFCNIELPHINGVEWVKTLKNPPIIIFMSRDKGSVIQSYEVDTLDFLLKPIPFDRFFKSSIKIREKKIQKHHQNIDEFIFVKVGQQIKKIYCKDIKYLEAQNNYIKIVTMKGNYLTLLSLKEMLPNLPFQFMKVHKSYIVNLNHVHAIEGNCVLIDQEAINVSRTLRSSIFDTLTQGKFILKA